MSAIDIANPNDHNWTTTLFELQFGVCGDTRVLTWANSFDDALENAIDHLISRELYGIFTDLMEDLQPGEEPDETDMTVVGHTTVPGFGMAAIPSWEWHGHEVTDPFRIASERQRSIVL